ncbi:MAG: L-aspartate oxidase [Planctomycetaceae bacterium]|jgi:L-aspartate oxidase|nr:L-aspartate oxidase [Planctomycetaceae bacterium]MBT6157865.1 L-aspartate oxidase [Planctomycetaceae bacterium]MBT6487065.1 L-aspartate oxidase [Planctomycetaceae bacterium]MBT6493278.1 L-aspartate oxidase [Planctomycetaceae bacterium]
MKTLSLAPKHRYLTRFDPKRIPHSFTDVLIIGGGIAGLRAAMAVDPSLQTVVLSKDVLSQSNSAYAQGGIAGVLDPLDDFTNHIADTVAAGKGLCDAAIVEMVVREAPELIKELIGYGTQFDKEQGEIALTQEGGHSHRRVAHALGDATGKEIMRAMMQRVREREAAGAAQIWEETFVIDLLTHEGVCRGALVWNPRHGKTFVWSKQTILATGGAGRLYRETTNPDIATADGHAFSFRAGAELRDLEFVQFHPTVLYIAGSSRHLISEAVRGEGAYLRDSTGCRFMSDYDDAMELAPRDVVSRAITSQMDKSRHPCVYLDLTHLDEELIGDRFPHIAKVCAEFGLDIARDLIPVRPGAHYMVGGLSVDSHGKTTLPGLWAAGEATSSGLHGANRLGSNSLLEGLFFGLRAGSGASQQASDEADNFSAIPLISDWSSGTHVDDELDLLDIFNSLTSLMWRNVGIARDAEGLEKADLQVGFWDRYVSEREFSEPHGWELQNMLLTARLIIAAATARNESRGVHYRNDFPETNSAMQQHIAIVADLG